MTMATVDNKPMVTAETRDNGISMILRAAQDPSVSVEKVRELYAIAKEMNADAAKRAFAGALARVQAACPRILKHGLSTVEKDGRKIRESSYARYEDIDKTIRPIVAEEGFAFTFDSKPGTSGMWTFSCEMLHREGHSETKYLSLGIDTGGAKNAVQSMGSTVSYARRYLLAMHLNLVTVDEDDDGAGGRPNVTPDQAETLRAQVEALGGNTESHQRRVLKWLNVTRYEDILASDFERAKAGIAQMGKERA